MKKIKLILILVFMPGVMLLDSNQASAQSITTPYSILGVGDLNYIGFTQNQAIGELGVGYSTIWHINHTNPAWLYRNTFSTFQVSLEGETRRYATFQGAESSGTAGLRNLAISLPIMTNRLTASLGVLPYSTVNYNISSEDVVEGTNANFNTKLSGDGGLSQAFFSTGLRIGKNFGIGARANYIFGKLTNLNEVVVNDSTVFTEFRTVYERNTTYNDLILELGLSYRKQIGDNNSLSLGLTYEQSTELNGERIETVERRTLFDDRINADTLSFIEDLPFSLPAKTSLGFFYEKVNKYGFGVDITLRDWTEAGFEGGVENYQNTIKIAAGGEYIPTYNDVNSYFKRATYRAGFTYEQLPYSINNTRLTDFGINFGTSFPVGGYSSLDVAFKIGQRGTTENELIRETYLKFSVGATINDRWFIRRKYD